MHKLYTKLFQSRPASLVGFLMILVLLGAVIFHPTLNQIHRFQRKQQLASLLTDIQKPNFQMREFWQFREFYSAGNLTFNPDTVSLAGALQFKPISTASATLITFHSPLLFSNDSIVANSEVPNFMADLVAKSQPKSILFQLADRVAFVSTDEKLHLLFLRPSSEMKQTLGLFDYGNYENKVLQNRKWLDETTISPS